MSERMTWPTRPEDPRKYFRDKNWRPDNWPECPQSSVAIPVHSYLTPIEIRETAGVLCSPSETRIFFPADRAVNAHEFFTDDGAIPIKVVEEYGWQVVKGLGPNDVPSMTGGHTLTIRCNSRLLVPPPGLWPADLPALVEQGDIEPRRRTGWFDIFEMNAGFLAWNDSRQARHGWNTKGASYYRYLDLPGRERWWFHASLPGLIELLNKMYPDGLVSVKYDELRNDVTIRVPRTAVSLWIGAQGSRAKFLAEWLGVRRLTVDGV